MEDYFSDLIEIMDKESKLYSELTEIQKNKKKIIIENDVKALDAITKKEQGFVKTIVNLESLRAQVIDGFCQSKGINKVNTIDDIMEHLEFEDKLKLKVKRDTLANVINDILEVNDLNTKLLEQSVEYVNYTMELARSLSEEDAGYAENAMDKTINVDKNIFDVKI